MPDELGDRMKQYEQLGGCQDRLMPLLPIIVRLDGVSFHTFTKGLVRPYDGRMVDLMVESTRYMVQETNARIGYTQSDEISLLICPSSRFQQVYFGGRKSKLTSVLAAKLSVFFNESLRRYIPEKVDSAPVFDCRVWSVPTQYEAVNSFLWRERDATKNAISAAAQSLYSSGELHGASCSEMQELLFAKGVNFNDYPACFKRGTYVQRRIVEKPFTSQEIESLPQRHHARLNSELVVRRSQYVVLAMLPLDKVENKIEVLFDGAEPVYITKESQ